ncbi:hypothetical protein [Hyphomicrobium sp.]|uniref:hypothetical protein n=1 Tax=Hyphomicrobium sp. TaxID=82 RepID=UPI0025C3FE88|nr:hypothetical protein [Hyphomicrobium sp.]MCC7253657.1 hypothetical protein [Hyphomicrobium sp.]
MTKQDQSDVRVLSLNLERSFFEKIVEGKKPYEYRERRQYWASRLEGKTFDVIRFRIGHRADAPELLVECQGIRKVLRGGRPLYAIKLGKILDLRRWPPDGNV